MRYYVTDKGLESLVEVSDTDDLTVLVGTAMTGFEGIDPKDFGPTLPSDRLEVWKSGLDKLRRRGYLTTDRHKIALGVIANFSVLEAPSSSASLGITAALGQIEGIVPEGEDFLGKDFRDMPAGYLNKAVSISDQ